MRGYYQHPPDAYIVETDSFFELHEQVPILGKLDKCGRIRVAHLTCPIFMPADFDSVSMQHARWILADRACT